MLLFIRYLFLVYFSDMGFFRKKLRKVRAFVFHEIHKKELIGFQNLPDLVVLTYGMYVMIK